MLLICSLSSCWLPIKGPDNRLPHRSNALGMEFVKIPAGSFIMGLNVRFGGHAGGNGNLEPREHNVTLTKPFWLQTTEVTQQQWAAVMGKNSLYPIKHWTEHAFQKHAYLLSPYYQKKIKPKAPFAPPIKELKTLLTRTPFGSNYPVFKRSWFEVQEFINKLNERNHGHYRLPTEAEWEYAARAGTQGHAYYLGNNIDPKALYEVPVKDYAMCVQDRSSKDFSNNRLVPVKSYPPNPWGLYDMYGNVFEMLSHALEEYPTYEGELKGLYAYTSWGGDLDQIEKSLPQRIDPQGPSPLKTKHVGLRGGGFASPCNSYYRYNYSICYETRNNKTSCTNQNSYTSTDVGFRLVWEAEE